MTQTETARQQIAKVAAEHGWTIEGNDAELTETIRKGTRYVRVDYTVADRVRGVAWQTGSTGGRSLHSGVTGKAARVVELLALARWAR